MCRGEMERALWMRRPSSGHLRKHCRRLSRPPLTKADAEPTGPESWVAPQTESTKSRKWSLPQEYTRAAHLEFRVVRRVPHEHISIEPLANEGGPEERQPTVTIGNQGDTSTRHDA